MYTRDFVGKRVGAGDGLGRRMCSLCLGKEREERDRAVRIGIYEVGCDELKSSENKRSQPRVQTEG